jgi:hypothetical protein
VAGVFGAGYLAGSAAAPTAQAQMGEMGSEMMKQAGQSGGALGQAAKLGSTISEMQKSVDDLNKSLQTLSTIKAALGGG